MMDNQIVAFLNQLSTAVIVFVEKSPEQWVASHWNHALGNLREDFGEGLEGRSPKTFIEASPKSNCPFCLEQSIKPNEELPIHTAMFEIAENEQLRVKIKHDWLDNKTMIIWAEPYSEDVALTQAHADFVSTVSHEFRTPLTSIKGFADTLLRYAGKIDIDQQKRFVNIIKHQADRLTRLVENLLIASKLGAQRTQFIYRPISVKKTVDRIVQSLEGKLPEPRTFKVEIPEGLPDVWADPDKIEQVLLNLIDNAAKYSYAESTVEVQAKVNPDNDDNVIIDVSDEGVGIPAEHLPNIFNKFSRIDNPLTRDVEGTGLGLYITKSMTKAMGGDISVTSEEGKGSTFTVVIPIATAERQKAAAEARGETEDD